MSKLIDGVSVSRNGDYAICHIDNISDQLKDLIRAKLTSICHGSFVSDYKNVPLISYKATLKSFLERYKNKADTTKIGMIGELLSHTLIPEYFEEFEVVSAFFNMEEKSIRKGFDLILYRSTDPSVWITEVKSGNLHKDKDHDETVWDLLDTAKADLNTRLNAQEMTFWLNALYSVRKSIGDTADYKGTLESILLGYGEKATNETASSDDKFVVLVSSLFEPLKTKIRVKTAASFHKKVSMTKTFSKVVVFCMQKTTYSKVAEFLENEAARPNT
jgi:hypothetical protein